MEPRLSTTPFGRRTLTLAHVASQALAKERPPEKAVHKWNLFRDICTAKAPLGVNERALAVLDALLTFHPETVLTGEQLVVFPSNQQLALRAHGMSPATLRRHLAVLVDAGLIIRRDSPNGKRYARKGRGGDIELAFGFDLSPLVVRSAEIERSAEDVRLEERALKLVRERITICRRDIAKMIATAMEEGVPAHQVGQGPSTWQEIHALYRSIIGRIPRTAPREILEPIADELSMLADEILNLLEIHTKAQNLSGNESHSERHKQNSKPDLPTALEPRFPESRGIEVEIDPEPVRKPEKAFPLGMVLDACPDIIDYARGGISNWRDFLAAAAMVRSMLGISPSAWFDAQSAMGETEASIVVAAILQRGDAISSAGGYLRGLTRKAETNEFSIGPMLMALIGSRRREPRRA
ncbi:replication initiation protein RepC (plasmid) [Bosea sp. F3-2]|uniref:plasmid replication protein RepC n=1 Tax=Bosea sp. F3-2 TaxID=2599640 RepID=UPI0011EBA853|nr:plasmid replication protein RepC [Bosea sp. F3-2]QEL26981.1 replication initiation protein RepC [Bosea sp. F3-2]